MSPGLTTYFTIHMFGRGGDVLEDAGHPGTSTTISREHHHHDSDESALPMSSIGTVCPYTGYQMACVLPRSGSSLLHVNMKTESEVLVASWTADILNLEIDLASPLELLAGFHME